MTRDELLHELDRIIDVGIVNAHNDKDVLTAVRKTIEALYHDLQSATPCKVCAYGPRELCDPDADETTEAFQRWRDCYRSNKSCWKWRMDNNDSE